MLLKFFILAILAYIVFRVVRRDLVRRFRHLSPQSRAGQARSIETVRCPRCAAYVPIGTNCSCAKA